MWRGIEALLLMLLLLSSNVCAQTDTFALPVEKCSAIEWEFRRIEGDTLHTGLIFKTGGRKGLPVICVKDGVVARVKVSATGYGNALYLNTRGNNHGVWSFEPFCTPNCESREIYNIIRSHSRWMRICRAMNSVFVRETRLPIAGIPVLRVVLICILRCATRRVNML